MPGATLPRRLLAQSLVRLRTSAKISREAAAKHIQVGQQTLWRWETGQGEKPLNKVLVAALCALYEAPPEVTQTILTLAQEADGRSGWWHQYAEAIPQDFDIYLSLEDSASEIWMYHATLLPGLLQTREYRRQVVDATSPGLTPQEAKQRVEIAVRRQKRLNDDDFKIHLLLSEAALRNRIGGAEVMAKQLRRINVIGKIPNVSLRVVPQSAGAHLGLFAGPFILLEFPPQQQEWMSADPIVYVEHFAGDLYQGDGAVVQRYRTAYSAIEDVALSIEESRGFISKIAKEYSA